MGKCLQLLYLSIDKAAKPEVSPQDRDEYLQNMETIMAMAVRVVDAGADVNLKTTQDYTALHFAAYLKLPKIIDALIGRGADLNATDEHGANPAYYGIVETIGKIPVVTFPKLPQAKKSIAEKVETVAAPVIEKTPAEILAERQQELKKLMSDLQRAAKGSVKVNKETEVEKMLWLIETTNSDLNITTSENYSALHLAARFGRAHDVETLMQKGANINAVTSGGLSVARCAINGGNNEVVKSVLGSDRFGFGAIANLLKEEIESKNKSVISLILGEEKVITKFANLPEKESKNLGLELRVAVNKISKHAIFKNTKEGLEKFLSHPIILDTQRREAELLLSKDDGVSGQPLSKAEKERRRKAENRIKAEIEEKKHFEVEIRNDVLGIVEAAVKFSEDRKIEAVKKAEREEAQKILAEIIMMSGEDRSVAPAVILGSQSRGSLEVELLQDDGLDGGEVEGEEEDVTTNESADDTTSNTKTKSDSISSFSSLDSEVDSPTSALSPNAAVFDYAAVGEKLEVARKLKSEQEEMKTFLRGPRQIKSVQNLPPFLQPSLSQLLQDGHRVLLKGSTVYQAHSASRAPSDLDVEILVRGMSKRSDEKVQKFVQKYFGVEVGAAKIYRGPNQDGSVFTVNVKDEARGFDLSFYDQYKQPPDYLSWTVSKEEKIFFAPDGNARRVKPSGFSAYLRENDARFNPHKDFLINSEARGLMLRLCFLQTIGHITGAEILGAMPAISPYNPVDLLFKELKLDRPEAGKTQDQQVREKISAFAESHKLDENLKKNFVKNLAAIANICRIDAASPKDNPQYFQLYKTIAEMEKKPAPNVSSSLGVNLAGNKVSIVTQQNY